MPCGACPKDDRFQIVGGWGMVARRWCKGIHARVSSGERVGGWWGICWEGARVVGCAWSLSLASLRATVGWSGFFVRFPSGIFMLFVGLLWDFRMRFHAFYLHNFRMRFPYESSCFPQDNLLMRFANAFGPNEIWRYHRMIFHAFWPQRDFHTRFHAYFLHSYLMRLFRRDFVLISCIFILWGFLIRFHALQLHNYFMKSHGFWMLRDLDMRFHAFWASRDFMRFSCEISWFWDRYEISLWDFSLFCCIIFSWDFLKRFHAFCGAIFVWDFFFCKIYQVDFTLF